MVRVTDPAGTATLFGIDKASAAIRLAGFATPRGWHVRIYDDFVRLKNPDWLQARKVTLYYNGVKANEVFWTGYTINAPIAPDLFKRAPGPVTPPDRDRAFSTAVPAGSQK